MNASMIEDSDTAMVLRNPAAEVAATSVAPAKAVCFLLDLLPLETRQKIWKLVVRVDGPVQPNQIRSRSNKFTAGEDGTILDIMNVIVLNKQIYGEVANAHLFYQANTFLFKKLGSGPSPMLNYLAAITDHRRNAIKHIVLNIGDGLVGRKDLAKNGFSLLRSLPSLESLELILAKDCFWHGVNMHAFAVRQLRETVQGIPKLTITLGTWSPEVQEYYPHLAVSEALVASQFAKLQNVLKSDSTLPKEMPTISELQQEMETANLDIHGEGRLGEDHKPGVIASRTRQGRRAKDNVTQDGIIPQRTVPRYGTDGLLTLPVGYVMDARFVTNDIGDDTLELLTSRTSIWPHPLSLENPEMNLDRHDEVKRAKVALKQEDASNYSWEDIHALDLTSYHMLYVINEFYRQIPQAVGLRFVHDLAKEVNQNDSEQSRGLAFSFVESFAQLLRAKAREEKRVAKANEKAIEDAAKSAKKQAHKEKKDAAAKQGNAGKKAATSKKTDTVKKGGIGKSQPKPGPGGKKGRA